MLQLIRTLMMIPIAKPPHVIAKPPHVHVAVIGSSDEPADYASPLEAMCQMDHNLHCLQSLAAVDMNDTRTDVGATIDTIRRFRMRTFTPNCGPGCEQSDPSIIWQRTCDGHDGDGVRFIVNYSIVRGICTSRLAVLG